MEGCPQDRELRLYFGIIRRYLLIGWIYLPKCVRIGYVLERLFFSSKLRYNDNRVRHCRF